MKLRPYPKYKDSGVEWLGEIPEEWGTESLRRIGRITNGSTPDSTNEKYWNGNIVWFTPDDLGKNQTKYIRESKRKITVAGYKNCGTVIVPKNSLILSTRAPIGHLALTAVDACFNQGCKGIVFKNNFNPSFYYYYFLSIKGVLNAYGQGTTFFELGANKLAIIPVIIPPEKEKETIVNFLDQKTPKIDDLIKKNERLIELLKEKRQVIISQAVTKGLDPNAKMKDSGIEWPGKIPERWEVKKLKHVTDRKLKNGIFKKKEFYGSGIKLINVFDVYRHNFQIDFDSLDRIEATTQEIHAYSLKSGDILFVRSSLKLEGVGASAYVSNLVEPAVFECHLIKIRPTFVILPEYLISYLNSSIVRQKLVALANSVTMATLGQSALSNLEIQLPPMSEQQKIVDFLKKETTKIDEIISKVELKIDELKEYRQTLISNVVTGKVRASDTA